MNFTGSTHSSTLVFIDSNVTDINHLLTGLASNTEVITLDTTQDGIEQITQALSERKNIDSIQIVSHGADGQLQLGATTLTSEALNTYTQQLSQWGQALNPDGNILLLGCNVAASDAGKAFVQQLSQITGAHIAASDDLTGNANLGGDWLLEYATGLIDAPLAFQLATMEAYEGVLADFSVNNANDLRRFLNEAQSNADADQITLTGNISGFTESFAIDLQDGQPLSIIGNGRTIDGGNNTQLFNIVNGKVLLSNLTLQNGLARGGDGASGGGGGLGAGGALFVRAGNVTVENVTFNNNQARGGNSPNPAGAGGGSGSGGQAGGEGGKLNNGLQTPCPRGEGGDTNGSSGRVGAQDKQHGGAGSFGTGGGGAGGGGGDEGLAPDGGRSGGNGGAGGFGGGGGGGGGGGRDDGEPGSEEEHVNRGSGGQAGEFGGNGGGDGGAIQDGAQGGGGAGLGGAIFANNGASLSLINTTFNNNLAEGGTGANNGQGRGGAIFVMGGTQVNAVGTDYSGNSASTGENEVYGNIGTLTLPTLSVSSLMNPAEPNTNGAFRLTLNQAFSNDITVNYNIAGTATKDTDYTIPQTIVIPAGQTVVEIPVTVKDETRFDPNETVILTLAAGTPNFYKIGVNSATLTLNDNEPEVSITAGTTPKEANEVSGKFNINLTRPAPDAGLEIKYTVAGTASKDDYTATLNNTEIPPDSLIIRAGSTTASVNIKPIDDSLIEGEETLKFTLIEPSNLENYAVKNDATQATLSITDNEKPPIVKLGKIGNPSEQGPTSGSFSIFLADPETGEPLENPPLKSDGQALELEVSYEISGTANNGADYSKILTSPITIPAGKTSAALPVETLEDLIDENDETVTITLKDIKPDDAIYTIDTTPATLNLTDNDTVGITVSPINGSTHEQGGEAGFTVQLNSQPEQPVTFNFTSSDTTEGQLQTPSITFDSSNWNQLETVKVKGADDSERDGDRTYAIQTTISSDDVNYSTLNLADIPVTNIDDETENVLISQSNGSTEISEAGATDSFEVVLTGFPINDIVVNVTPDSQTDLGNGFGQPIALNFTPETASTPQTVTVKAVDDDTVEGKHQSTISYIANSIDPLYAGLKGEITAAIADNDNPTVSVKSAGNGSEQSLIPGIFQLTLDHPAPSEGLTVNYTISGVATPGGDYTAVGLNTVSKTGSVYIAPEQTGGNLNITPIQDLITELGGESVTLKLETGAGYNIGTATPLNVIITDDDVPGVRVLESGNGTQVVEQSATPPNINKADTYQISLTSSPAVGEIVTITPNFNGENLKLFDANQNPITEITFDSTNWNQSKTITVVGLNDNQPGTPEQLITHSTSSTDPTSSYNTGLEIDGKPLPNVTVAITEPTYNSAEIADGLGLLLERIAESLRQMFKDTSVPIIGSLSGSEPAFIDTIKNNIVNAVKSTANLTQDKLKTLLTDQLKTIFPNVNVISEALPEDVSFSIDLGKRYATAANLSKDFGLPGLGLEVKGQAKASFEYDLDLKFGYHQDFGFYVDTAGTKLSADALVGLNDNFNAKATLGFFDLTVKNGAEDTVNGGTKKTQASLDANFALKDIDLDAGGNLIANSGDGNRLTLTELKGFNQLRQTNQATLEKLFDLKLEAGAKSG